MHEGGDLVGGLAVDALHRVLGLRCPGEPPDLAGVVASIWLDVVMRAALDRGHVAWADAVALHPGDPGPTGVPPSTETLVEATVRAARELDWGRLRHRATRAARCADLTAGEADWMDDVLFGRWVVASMPDGPTVVEVLRASGSVHAADGLGRVLDALERRGPDQRQMTTR
ncbi:MAG: hypothetical protein ACYC2O_04610 [Microthrixaceae bacterium]